MDRRARAASDARALLAAALELSVLRIDAEHAELGLRNAGAAHAVPTGAGFLRDIWVDVRIVDARGRTIDVPRVIDLGTRMLAGETDVSVITEADHLEPRSLAPGDERTASIELPAGVTLPVRVEASLRAHAIRSDTLEALSLPPLPVLEVASASLDL